MNMSLDEIIAKYPQFEFAEDPERIGGFIVTDMHYPTDMSFPREREKAELIKDMNEYHAKIEQKKKIKKYVTVKWSYEEINS